MQSRTLFFLVFGCLGLFVWLVLCGILFCFVCWCLFLNYPLAPGQTKVTGWYHFVDILEKVA